MSRRKRDGVVVRTYPRIGARGERLRRRPKTKRGKAQRAAEQRYRLRGGSRAKDARRRVRKLDASVALTSSDHLRINALYAEAARRTAETGVVHHVDHDVPLALGGKHHPDNLLIVPARINLEKGARYASMWDFISS